MKKKIIIATIKSWNIENARKFAALYKKKCETKIITQKENLTYEKIREIKPDYIFFPHWSWIIPESIWQNYSCVVFHMTDLPFGRGGSPLQNLIARRIYKTKISAILVNQGLDTGDIFMKEPLNIKEGNANQILQKVSSIVFKKMMPRFLNGFLKTEKQKGKITTFRRRKSDESNLDNKSLTKLSDFYDFIRMLDGEGYPQAFIKIGKYKITFSNVSFSDKKTLKGQFEIKENE